MKPSVSAVILCALLSTTLGGCALITLDIDVKPDLSADFVEKIRLSKDSSRVLAFTEANVGDYWTRFRKLAKQRGWKLKERSADYFVLSGHYEKERVSELGGLLADQFASVALDYGGRSFDGAGGTTLIPSQVNVDASHDLFSRAADISYDIDLSFASLSRRAQLPEAWRAAFSKTHPDFPEIRVSVKTPFDLVKTNGQYDAATGKVHWRINLAEHNRLTATYRIIDWMRIIFASLGLLLVLGVVALLTFRPKAKPDTGGDVGNAGGELL